MKYYQSSCNKIRVAYNNTFRVLHGIPRYVSARLHQINVNVTTFDAHIRKCLFCFYRRVELSNNLIIIICSVFQSKFHNRSKEKFHGDVG